MYIYIYIYITIYLDNYISISIYLSIYLSITRDRLLKLQQSAQLEEQYNNDVSRNNYGVRLKVSCLCNYQAYV